MLVRATKNFVLASFILLLFVSLGCQSPTARSEKDVSIDNISSYVSSQKAKWTVFFVIDQRFSYTRTYMDNVIAWSRKKGMNLNFYCIYVSHLHNDPPSGVQVFKKDSSLGRLFTKHPNQAFLYTPNGQLFSEFPIWTGPGSLVKDLATMMGCRAEPEKLPRTGKFLNSYAYLSEIVELRKRAKNLLVLVFYPTLCFSCASGSTLMQFEKLAQTYPECSFVCVLLSGGNESEIQRICSNYRLTVKVFGASHEGPLYSEWKSREAMTGEKSGLRGLFMVVGPSGKILACTHVPGEIEHFLIHKGGS